VEPDDRLQKLVKSGNCLPGKNTNQPTKQTNKNKPKKTKVKQQQKKIKQKPTQPSSKL